MIKFILMLIFVGSLIMPVSALEIEAPKVPQSGSEIMPENTESFLDALWELLTNGIEKVRPTIADASEVCFRVICAVLIVSLVQTGSENTKRISIFAGCSAVAALLLSNTKSMIYLAVETIREISDYGKLLYPVMTAAMAAQGGMTSSKALYVGTAVFDVLLGKVISSIFVPMVYLFLVFSVAGHAMEESSLNKLGDCIKKAVSWSLKTILTVFTTYMSITGVVSGTTDAAALKAAKVTISSVVPVVGGILSDSSEAILVSAGIIRNAAGIYGILAALAVFLEPFLRIGCQYLLLKTTAVLCAFWGSKEQVGLIEDFSAAMGLLLAMTGAVCLLLLISTVCFMKGIG